LILSNLHLRIHVDVNILYDKMGNAHKHFCGILQVEDRPEEKPAS